MIIDWIAQHWLVSSCIFVALLALLVVNWILNNRFRTDITSPHLYGFTAQIAFLLNYLLVPVACLLGFAAMLSSANNAAFQSIIDYFQTVDLNVPALTLIVTFAFLFVAIRSLPNQRNPDEKNITISPELLLALTAMHIAFYFSNLVFFFSYTATPEAYLTLRSILFILDAGIFFQLGYIHYTMAELRRDSYIHGH